jgi:hypothetical protein
MSATEFEELVADIKANGQHEPVAFTPDGRLLEGRHRALACEMAGVELKKFTYAGDPWLYSISKNARRRHMSVSQVAIVVASLATLGQGGDRRSDNFKTANAGLKTADVAKAARVPKTAIESAKTVLKDGTPHEIAAVKAGKAPLRKTANAVRERAKKTPVQSADPIEDVVRKLVAECNDGEWRSLTKMAQVVEAPKSTVREAIDRLGMAVMRSEVGRMYSIGGAEGAILAVAGLKAKAEPAKAKPDTSDLSKSAQDKLDAHKRRLDREFEVRLQQGIEKYVNEVLIPHYNGRIEKADRLLSGGKPFTNEEFAVLEKALHPDSSTLELRNHAFSLVKEREIMLRPEKVKLTGAPLPKTVADLVAQRKPKRTAQ